MHPTPHPNQRRRQIMQKKRTLDSQANTVLKAIAAKSYIDASGQCHDLGHILEACVDNTVLFDENDEIIADWETGPSEALTFPRTEIIFKRGNQVAAARVLDATLPDTSIGIVNAAHPRREGGSWADGGDDPECVLMRASTLHVSLDSPAGHEFHESQRRGRPGFYSDAVLLSQNVTLITDASGTPAFPVRVAVASASPPNPDAAPFDPTTNASLVDHALRERMARTLWALQVARTPIVVLPAFGVGAMQNDPLVVARIWADLVGCARSPFQHAFSRVVFAIPGKYFHQFKDEFETRVFTRQLEDDLIHDRQHS